MNYIITPYAKNKRVSKHKPLMIGCSGGGGHIAAITGLHGYLIKEFGEAIDLPENDPVLYETKPGSKTRDQISTGVGIMCAPLLGVPIKAVVSLTSFPVLPSKTSLDEEIQSLSNKEKGKKRSYIDMLLDVYPAGYESAAIWNVLQRNDKISELKKLINLQSESDRENYTSVLTYYVKALKYAAFAGTPYTEIISTQAMALPALCDAVIKYNEWLKINPQIKAPKIEIHQYMTDLPTEGAIHFFNPLSTLDSQQQKQMKLYGVGMKEEIINHFFPKGQEFKGIFDIPADRNPMVRSGFTDANLDNSSKFHETVSIALAGESDPYSIKKDEQIASIMLGSQASNDTVEYIESLFNNGMSKVFVFGGKNPAILEKINIILKEHPEYTKRIIPLGNQGDKEIAALMSRSNMVIIRGGGLSTMEQLSMKHNSEQTILIHHANSTKKDLTSGISWEDNNVKSLMLDLKARKVHSEKTSPKRAIRHIAEARLIAAVRRLDNKINIDDAIQFITKLPNKKLSFFVKRLNQSEQGKTPSLPKELLTYFSDCEVLAGDYVRVLNEKLDKGKTQLSSIIIQEVAELIGKQNNATLDPTRFDIDTVVHNINKSDFKDASPKLIAAVQSYYAIEKLQTTLSPQNEGSMNKKLTDFKKEYEHPKTKNDLLGTSDSTFTRILKKIVLQLAKYFPVVASNHSFEQDFSLFVNKLNKKDETMNEPLSIQPQVRP